MAEKTLIKRAKKGDSSAITSLYETYSGRVYFVCLKMLKNENDAADAMQDTFITVLTKLDSLKDIEKFESWLLSVAANKCRDLLKRKKPILFCETTDENDETIEQFLENEDEDIIPEKACESAQFRQEVSEIVDSLSDSLRLAVMYRYFYSMSVKEIATELECSENVVKTRLSRARQILKEKLESSDKSLMYSGAPMLVCGLISQSLETVCPIPFASSTLGSSLVITAKTAGIVSTVAIKSGVILASAAITFYGAFGLYTIISNKDEIIKNKSAWASTASTTKKKEQVKKSNQKVTSKNQKPKVSDKDNNKEIKNINLSDFSYLNFEYLLASKEDTEKFLTEYLNSNLNDFINFANYSRTTFSSFLGKKLEGQTSYKISLHNFENKRIVQRHYLVDEDEKSKFHQLEDKQLIKFFDLNPQIERINLIATDDKDTLMGCYVEFDLKKNSSLTTKWQDYFYSFVYDKEASEGEVVLNEDFILKTNYTLIPSVVVTSQKFDDFDVLLNDIQLYKNTEDLYTYTGFSQSEEYFYSFNLDNTKMILQDKFLILPELSNNISFKSASLYPHLMEYKLKYKNKNFYLGVTLCGKDEVDIIKDFSNMKMLSFSVDIKKIAFTLNDLTNVYYDTESDLYYFKYEGYWIYIKSNMNKSNTLQFLNSLQLQKVEIG